MSLFIGYAGCSRVGKDTLHKLVADELLKRGHTSIRISLGDMVRSELQNHFLLSYGIDIWNQSPKQKELTRPMLVHHAEIQKKLKGGDYWCKLAQGRVELDSRDSYHFTDIRYREEMNYVKNHKKNALIYIERYSMAGGKKVFVQPANEQEAKNDAMLRAHASYWASWETTRNEAKQREFAANFVNWLKKTGKLHGPK